MKKIIYLLIITLLLISCNNADETSSHELQGIVLDKTEASLFITSESGPYYAHVGDLDTSSIDLGDTVTFDFDGTVMESYPMQIQANDILKVEKGKGLSDLSGRVVSVEDQVIEVESDGEAYVVQFENSILFGDDISETIEEGNDITVTYNGDIKESYPMQIEGLRVTVNDKLDLGNDQPITLDKRESVSGIIGDFPKVIIDETGHVNLNDVFAVELDGNYTYELIFEDMPLEVLMDGYQGQYYYGFRASVTGEHVIKFKQISNGQLIKVIEISVNVN